MQNVDPLVFVESAKADDARDRQSLKCLSRLRRLELRKRLDLMDQAFQQGVVDGLRRVHGSSGR
jgi:hypothetical protein